MSATMTITRPVASSERVHKHIASNTELQDASTIPLPQRVRNLVGPLIKEMLDSALFNASQQQGIPKWYRSFNERQILNLTTPATRRNAAVSLCFLIGEYIYPTTEMHTTCERNVFRLLDFEDKAKAAIGLLVSESPDKFFKTYLDRIKQEKEFSEKLVQIDALFTELIRAVDASADKIEEEFKRKRDQLNASIKEAKESQEKISQALKQKFDALIAKIQQNSKNLMISSGAATDLGQGVVNHQTGANQTLNSIPGII